MSKAQPQTDSIELPEPTATPNHPDDLRDAAAALAAEHEHTYTSNDDGVTVHSIEEVSEHHSNDAKVVFPEGTTVSSSTAEVALADTAYDLHGVIVHTSGKIGVELDRSNDDEDDGDE